MRRRLRKLGAFLLLGAAVNVAIAWWCASYPRQAAPSTLPVFCTDPQEWSWIDPVRGKTSLLYIERSAGIGFDRRYFFYPVGDDSLDNAAERIRAGWPLRSLEGGMWMTWPWEGDEPVWKRQKTGRQVPDHAASFPFKWWNWPQWARPARQVLPLQPLWPGFAVNSLFHAIMAWTLCSAASAPWRLRRRRRANRDLCVYCGYPIGASSICTECGRSLPPRRDEARA